jgi:hydroxyethylthiazole kinase-like uncharacterized protein yjeF
VIRQVGMALAGRVRLLTQPGDAVLLLAGAGHNGDDVRAARPHLTDRSVTLLEMPDPGTSFDALDRCLDRTWGLVVDGWFGIGLNRDLSPDWQRCISRVNQSGVRVMSVDVPSGLDAASGLPRGAAIEAAETWTVGAPKEGLLVSAAARWVGRLEVSGPVGLLPPGEVSWPCSPTLWWVEEGDFAGFPPRRPVMGHKGTFGHVQIVAGSQGYHGAAVLAARAAQRARPGLVTVCTTERVYSMVASQLASPMVRPVGSSLDWMEGASCILIGPGLAGPDLPADWKVSVAEAWRSRPVPVVVDASALDGLVPGAFREGAVRVITPHPGEAARMLGCSVQEVQEDRPGTVRELSRRHGGAWVVLKGCRTLVGRQEGPIHVIGSGNSGLAQGGSGDVLAGWLAGWLAQGSTWEMSRLLGHAVWEHGAAADRLERIRRNWVMEDLLEELGRGAVADRDSGMP